MRYDALVIGAGPVGCVAAGHLAGQGHSVLLVEEHRSIGKPMQCGGLVSPRLRELVDFPFMTLNSVRGAYVHSPSGIEFKIRAREEKGIVIDRTDFDRNAAAWAVEKGAFLRLGCRVRDLSVNEDGISAWTSSGDTITAEMVIGAEGPASITARKGGLPPIKEFVTGYEIEAIGRPRDRGTGIDMDRNTDMDKDRGAGIDMDRAASIDMDMDKGTGIDMDRAASIDMGMDKGTGIDMDMVEVYTGQRVGRGFFSWVIPSGGDRLRIGTGVHSSSESAYRAFHHLICESKHSSRFSDIQPLSIHAGGIPIGMRDRISSDRLIVIGDAAGLAKPVSGGGVITGIISARIAAEVAAECITDGRLCARDLAPYQKMLLMKVGKELKRAWKLRKTFMYLSDAELDHLFSLITKPEVLKIINEKGDIDYPGRISIDLLRASPGLLKFAFKYLGAGLL